MGKYAKYAAIAVVSLILAGCGGTAPVASPTAAPVNPPTSPAELPQASQNAEATANPSEVQTVRIGNAGEMSFQELLGRIGDVYEYNKGYFSDSGNARIVKRGDVAYYASGYDIRVYDGRTAYVILRDVNTNWMYIDEDKNLWFSAKGGIGIADGWLTEYLYLYKYDRLKDTFSIALESNEARSLIDMYSGFVKRYKSYILFTEEEYIKSYNMENGKTEIVAKTDFYPPQFFISEDRNAIYYIACNSEKADDPDEYYLLENYGEKNQKMIKLDMGAFPNGEFDYRQYVLENFPFAEDNPAGDCDLYVFQGTGYKKIDTVKNCSYSQYKPWEASPWDNGYGIVVTDDWIAFPSNDYTDEGDVSRIDVYDRKTKSWHTFSSSEMFAFPPDTVKDGRFWFIGDCNAPVIGVYAGGAYIRYDVSAVFPEVCLWAGMNDGIVFLNDWIIEEMDSPAAFVFLPETQKLYEIRYPEASNEMQGD